MSPLITAPATVSGGLGSEVRVAQLSGPPASLTENINRTTAIAAHVAALTNFCKDSNYRLNRSIDSSSSSCGARLLTDDRIERREQAISIRGEIEPRHLSEGARTHRCAMLRAVD